METYNPKNENLLIINVGVTETISLVGFICFYANFMGYISVNICYNKRKLVTQSILLYVT